jgi:hypothetical protein
MGPDRHVARVRRKTSGYHNRRFKGKRPQIDLEQRRSQEQRRAQNVLPKLIREMLSDLERNSTRLQQPLLAALRGLFLLVQPQTRPVVWMAETAIYLAFREAYIELRLEGGGVEAWCFTDDEDSLEIFRTPEKVAAWLLERGGAL